ncbi:hypothetical protein IFR05_016560, partial [Cadophora sp. M221]
PPPPTWLTAGLTSLLTQYPGDRFEGVMRYTAVNSATEMPCPAPPPGQTPDGVKWMYLPRIRCHDCPGKLYTPGPETTVGNFEERESAIGQFMTVFGYMEQGVLYQEQGTDQMVFWE